MLSLLLALSTTANAADVRWRPGPPPPPPPRPPRPAVVVATPADPQKTVSLTFDAVDLTQGLVAFDGEIRVAPKTSVVVTGGLGSCDELLLYKIGLEARQYFVGDFDTGVYVGLGADGSNTHLFLPIDDALAIGPSLGAKVTVPVVPITLEASVGADVVVASSYTAIGPSLGVGVGLSF